MKHKLYLKKVSENGIISFRDKKANKITVKIIDKFKHNIDTVYSHKINNAIIVSKEYAGCDACIFCEY